MKHNHTFSFLLIAFWGCIFSACQQETEQKKANFQRLDLVSYAIPVAINAPEGAKVMASNKTQEGKGINVVGEKGFNLRIDILTETADESHDARTVKENEKSYQIDGENKILLDEAQGFVYEINDEDIGTDYGFFYVVIRGNQQIEFSQGNHQENFTKEEILKMYEAAKAYEK